LKPLRGSLSPLGAVLAAVLLCVSIVPVHADNAMGYRLLAANDAAQLPHNHGSLGMDVERASKITDAGMVFDLIRVKAVRRGSAAAQVGFLPGDQIVAVDGRVFESLAAFAAYVGSLAPGSRATVDYIPVKGGPAQAQRVSLTIGAPAQSADGMSTGAKVAIGVGAAALFGCYELGCFSHQQSKSGQQ
jgi:membrane-associated protease RseP (regulator of RpoE activity)